MPWTCPCCGFDANVDGQRDCQGGCGHVRVPRSVTLVGCATHKQITLSVDTSFGKYLLRGIGGDDAVYAAEPQFRICKDTAANAWLIRHSESAKNPTYCDGAPVTHDGAVLQEGSVVSLGPERMKLTVRFDD